MKILLPLTVACTLLGTAAPLFAQAPPAAPSSQKEKLGYSLGVDVAQTLKKQPFEFDGNQFAAAVKDVLGGGQQKMTDDQVREVLTTFSNEIRAKQQASAGQAQAAQDPAAIEKGKKEGADFLAANKAKPGVQTLPSGLQYKVVKDGTGAMPKATDKVTVKYRGTLTNGTEFDNSEKHGGTASFPVGGVIPGWTEALQKMKTGSKWQLFIPSNLAYGDRGAGADIPPGAALVFDVELVSIDK